MSFDKDIKRVQSRRNWLTIKARWETFFDEYDEIGSPPAQSVFDALQNESSALDMAGTEKSKPISIYGLETAAFREAVFLIHKACSLLRSVSSDVSRGQFTYSEVTAYTASFFLAKSICILSGVWVSPKGINGTNWVVDCMASDRSNYRTVAYQAGRSQIGHLEIWKLFKRVVDQCKSFPFDDEFQPTVKQLEDSSIARRRNYIQYWNTRWQFPDLHEDFSFSGPSLELPDNPYVMLDPDNDEECFSIFFCALLFRNANKLLSDFGERSNSLKSEMDLIKKNVSHPIRSMNFSGWLYDDV